MKSNFNEKTLNELFNYVKSPDLEFSVEAVKIFFDCASLDPNLNTLK